MDLRHWIRDNYEDSQNLIRGTGWKAGVRRDDLDDFTSRVVLRVIGATNVKHPVAFIASAARRQVVDDIRRRVARPSTVPLQWIDGRVEEERDWADDRSDPYREVEILDEVRRLGRNDARALLGHAMGMHDHELVENGQTLDAVTKRRSRARERMAA